ncbi:hypothetical protein GCM10025794_01140 [Massilia kyonggiensis]
MCLKHPSATIRGRIENAKIIGATVVISVIYSLFINYRNNSHNSPSTEASTSSTNLEASGIGLAKSGEARRIEPEGITGPTTPMPTTSTESGNDWVRKSTEDKLGIMSRVISGMKTKGCTVNFDAQYYVRQLNDFFAPREMRSVKVSDAFGLIATGAGENFACPET